MAMSQSSEPRSEFARLHWFKGREEGREEGRVLATAEAVIKVLEARGLPLSEEGRAAILAATELSTLEEWHDQAFTVTSVEELLRSEAPERAE